MNRKPFWKLVFILVATLAAASFSALAEAGATLDKIRKNKQLRCGVSEGLLGFSTRDVHGRWHGLDADFCRAVAAAVLGDPEKVSFVPLIASARFPALKLDTIDLLSRNTTYTYRRETDLGLIFAGILYYDHQAVMVPRSSGLTRMRDLGGKTICIVKGTTYENNLDDYFDEHAMKFTPMILNSVKEAINALSSGRCQAFTSDESQLAALRLQSAKGPMRFIILHDTLSKSPLGPVVRGGDDEWLILVKWVLFSLVEAEEQGVTRLNARFQKAENAAFSVQALLGDDAGLGKSLGISDDWVIRVIEAVGNYGEMFDRNIGRNSRLKLERGLNRLWTHGGLMYSPPFR